jgi:hypothetical protein
LLLILLSLLLLPLPHRERPFEWLSFALRETLGSFPPPEDFSVGVPAGVLTRRA